MRALLKDMRIVFLLFGILILAGCGGDEPTPTVEPQMTPVVEPTAAVQPSAATPVAMPSPLAAPVSPLAAPVSPLAVPDQATLTSPTTGAIVGALLIQRGGVETAIEGVYIGLADVIRDEQGIPKVSGYEPSAAQRAATDAAGQFVLKDLKPGSYTLILDAAVTQYQLMYPNSENTILVDVEPGKIVNLGALRYESLPIPGFQ
jgi:hypothetical protein